MYRILALCLIFILVLAGCDSSSDPKTGQENGDAAAAPATDGKAEERKGEAEKKRPRKESGPSADAHDMDLQDVPKNIRRRVATLILDVQGTVAEPWWQRPVLAERAVPLYTPGVPEPTHLEIAVKPTGSVIVSLGDHDSPIVEWSANAPITFAERLRSLAKFQGLNPGKIYRLGYLNYAIETPEGEFAGLWGNLPSKPVEMDPAFLKDTDRIKVTRESAVNDPKAGYVEIAGKPREDKTTFGAWGSWDQLKAGWLKARGPMMAQAARAAKDEWAIEREFEEKGRGLSPCAESTVALLGSVKNFKVSGPGNELVKVQAPAPSGGISRLAISPAGSTCGKKLGDDQGKFSVAIEYESGEKETLRFALDARASVKSKTSMVRPIGNAAWEEVSKFAVHDFKEEETLPNYALFADDTDFSGCLPNLAAVAWAEVFAWADLNYYTENSLGQRRYPDWGLYRQNGERSPAPDAVPSARQPEFDYHVDGSWSGVGYGVIGEPGDRFGQHQTDPDGPRRIIEEVTARIKGYDSFSECLPSEQAEIRASGGSLLEWLMSLSDRLLPSEAADGKRYVEGQSPTTAHARYKQNRNNDRDLTWKAYDVLSAKGYDVGRGSGTKHDYALPVVIGYNGDQYTSAWGVRWLEATGVLHSFVASEKFEFMVQNPMVYTGAAGGWNEFSHEIDEWLYGDECCSYWIDSDLFFVGWIDPNLDEARLDMDLLEKLRDVQVRMGGVEAEKGPRTPMPWNRTPDPPMGKSK